jgi:hypothetical protein
MYDDLYEYLILYRQLNMPGIGTFSLETRGAATDISNRTIDPPAYTISFDSSNTTPAKKFYNWLADRIHLPYPDAVVRFNSFAFDLKAKIMAGNKIIWDKVGTLTKTLSGDIRFESSLTNHRYDPPLPVSRVIRENAEHTVKVGEQHKTSSQMAELLSQQEAKRRRWWLPALVVGALLLIFLVIYFMQNGMSVASSGTQQRVAPANAERDHKLLP